MAWSRHRLGQTPSPHGDLVRPLLISSPLQTRLSYKTVVVVDGGFGLGAFSRF